MMSRQMIGTVRTVAPVPTPLDATGRFDVTALARHLGWLASEGLDGALILGTAVKSILRWMGFGDPTTRPPLLGLDSTRERTLVERFGEFLE